eukprot:NODE_14142_length_347_cov_3.140940_g12980_i0.p4 GENE.NODE_14142_length_347_cov_3.140940_g12980_i0~~NODE_14142_length_347_cov_3.140940_g12980_i0.p4  ORF type:complete len:68 (-),score=12.20 NODE_14142_length_347_cov_3.140940_g12980_i0:34-237(-)
MSLSVKDTEVARLEERLCEHMPGDEFFKFISMLDEQMYTPEDRCAQLQALATFLNINVDPVDSAFGF